MRVGKGKTFGAAKTISNVRSESLSEKGKLYENVVVPTVTYAGETLGLKNGERYKHYFIEMKYLLSMY